VSITAISANGGANPQAGAMMERVAAQTASPKGAGEASATGQQVQISFAPPTSDTTATPMGQLGSGLIDTMRNFEQMRSARRDSMSSAHNGPASPIDSAKQELLSGPASIRPASGGEIAQQAPAEVNFDDAVSAMTRSFDYAIETQLIVKTGSQFSTSASSLMRGQ